LLYLAEVKKLAASSRNQATSGLRFFLRARARSTGGKGHPRAPIGSARGQETSGVRRV
jgi:hypothetical protein